MTDAARKYIVDYCKKNNITPTALEQDGGIARDAIYSFVAGRVHDPKLSTMVSIANLLSISLDELVGRKIFLKKTIDSDALLINDALLREAISFVSSYIQQNKFEKYNISEAMYAISEIYEYSVSIKLTKIDKNFASYFCKKQIR